MSFNQLRELTCDQAVFFFLGGGGGWGGGASEYREGCMIAGYRELTCDHSFFGGGGGGGVTVSWQIEPKIARCDWLPEWARRSYLAGSEARAISRKENFPESHKLNPL